MYNGLLATAPACSVVNCSDLSADDDHHHNHRRHRMDGEAHSSKSSGTMSTIAGSRDYLISSLPTVNFDDSLTEIIIDDLAGIEPTSAILDFCKQKFLRPYLNLLGLIGLYPMTSDVSCCRTYFSHLQTITMIGLVTTGYFLQYYTSFRRDRGFYINSSSMYNLAMGETYSSQRNAHDLGEILFVYSIPSALHFFGFLSAIYVIRIVDNEQLQNLVERVFLMYNGTKRLCITLWLFVLGGFICLGLLLAHMILAVTPSPHIIEVGKYGKYCNKMQSSVKTILILTVFIHDAIQIIVLTTYCIQCHLLRLHLYNLKEKLVQHTIETIDWMREVLEFQKLLNHLNRRIATPVCFFTVMNFAYAFAGLVYLFQEYEWNSGLRMLALNIANFILWLAVGLIPFFFAASVTRSCKSTQASGHQIRVRPFVYHNTSLQDLDSTLLFVSSLNMSAKLFRMPIQGNYLYCSILAVSVVVLTVGMCLTWSLGSI